MVQRRMTSISAEVTLDAVDATAEVLVTVARVEVQVIPAMSLVETIPAMCS
jgi:hypothetical protein